MTLAVLIVDHGSRRPGADESLVEMAELVERTAEPGVLVRYAHMELAEPSVDAGVRACVDAGATEIVVVPYMLAAGRHAIEDIPLLVEEAGRAHPGVRLRVAPPLGVHPGLAAVVLARVADVCRGLPSTD